MFELPPLPFDKNALEPIISANTLDFHYGKHHLAYVNNLNKLINGSELASKSLEEIILESHGGVFNNAAQVFNHTFYWNCLSPNSQKGPDSELGTLIDKYFGSLAEFKEIFTQKAITLFGSGWCWLVKTPDDDLEIVQTTNAGCPLTDDLVPLLTIDVWEHAYYLDYQNARPEYLKNIWEIINWEFVGRNLIS